MTIDKKENNLEEGGDFLVEESLAWIKKIFSAFPAFRDPNYRLYFAGQLVSLIGTWLQMVAQGWLVLEITHSAFWVGAVSALGSLPILVFVLFGGVIVDRFSPKRILYLTNILPMMLAFTLGFLTLFEAITLFEIAILAFLLGLVNALDIPARHTFVAHMMGKRYLASAIALNAATFNGARIIGPSFAGILIALIGIGGTFIVNAVSFLAVIASLLGIYIKAYRREEHHTLHPLLAIKEGLWYAFSRHDLRLLMIATALISIFGWSPLAILPVVIQEVFHEGVRELGYLHSATGVGAVLAAVLVSLASQRMVPKRFIIGGNILLGISLLVFSFAFTIQLGLLLMFFVGFALISQTSVINSTIQHITQDRLRGRVMSIYVLMFRGMSPVGAFTIGYLAQHVGSQSAIRMGALVVLLTSAFLYLNRKHIPANHVPS